MKHVARLGALAALAACSAPGRPLSGAGADVGPPAPGAAVRPADATIPVPPPTGPHAPYTGATVGASGVVLGLITMAKQPPRAAVEPRPGPSACPGSVAAPAVEMAPTGGVIGAVVWLDDIQRGKPLPGADAPAAEVAFDGCVLRPRTVIVSGPSGKLAVRNDDPVRHVATLRFRGAGWLDTGSEAERTVAEWPMPLAGQRFEKSFAQFGLVDVSGDLAPAPHALAVVARHPYFAVTDADGRYRLADVPPGKYQVRAWYPAIDGTKEHELTALGSAEVVAEGGAEVNLVLVAP